MKWKTRCHPCYNSPDLSSLQSQKTINKLNVSCWIVMHTMAVRKTISKLLTILCAECCLLCMHNGLPCRLFILTDVSFWLKRAKAGNNSLHGLFEPALKQKPVIRGVMCSILKHQHLFIQTGNFFFICIFNCMLKISILYVQHWG